MSSAIVLSSDAPMNETMQLAEHFARSGFFADANNASKAVVKILAGRELGFSPMASMTGIHVIEGKPSIGAGLFAAMIKRSGRYDYRVVECSAARCVLQFFNPKSGEVLGPDVVVAFDEFVKNGTAVGRDGRVKTNWQRSPDDMLFARAISKGFRRYCPDLVGGVTVYADGEIEPSHGSYGELVEPDYPPPAEAVPPEPRLTDVQTGTILSLFASLGIDAATGNGYVARLYPPCVSVDDLSESQAVELIARLGAAVDKKAAAPPAEPGNPVSQEGGAA